MQDIQAKLGILLIYLSGVWHKKRYIMISMWGICLVGWAGVSSMPNQYESSAKIHADTKNILKPLLNGLAVQVDTDEELSVISKTLLSRPNLEAIARQTDMHLEFKTPERYENMLKSLATGITLKGNKSKVYSISYKHSDPEMAKKIVEATMQKFTDSIAGQTRKDNKSATGFLNEEIEKLRDRLESSEDELAEFKQKNQALLPTRGGSYYQNVSELNDSIEKFEYSIGEKRTEILNLKARFSSSDDGDDRKSSYSVSTKYDQRISQYNQSLDQLRIRYTEKHPNIIEAIQRLSQLEKLRKIEQGIIIKQAVNGGVTQSEDGANSVLQELSMKLGTLESEKQVLISRLKNATKKRDALAMKLDLIPSIEAKLVSLTRDYTVTGKSYSQLLARKESAELSSNLDRNTSSVKFLVLEPPMKPLFPIGPPRVILFAAVLIFSIGTGLALAFFASQMSTVISSPSHLKQALGKTFLIGQFEHFDGKKHKMVSRLKSLIFFISTAFLFTIFGGLIAHEFIYGQSPMIWLDKDI
jgi:polysaccharide chain length determinant protein (PEP-CTERM system associated)